MTNPQGVGGIGNLNGSQSTANRYSLYKNINDMKSEQAINKMGH